MPDYRTIIMKRLLFIFSFFCLPVIGGSAQNVLTLENCLRIGIENNLSLQGKRKAMQKSKYGVSENRVKLLPQINGFANFNDNVLGESFLHVEGERDIFRHSAQKSHTVVNSNLENIFLILIRFVFHFFQIL